MDATLTFLGTGTSMGVPTLGCSCAVCTSTDPRNRRTRPSVRIEFDGHTVLIDTGPDFHAQALREKVRRVDAVFYTHGHADHVLGMDDLRPLSFGVPGELPLYADDATADTLERIFNYTFRTENRYATSARVRIHRLAPEPGSGVSVYGACFQRIPLLHGRQVTSGYRFGSAAYLTDMNDIPPESIPLLQGLDLVILDALRPEPHPTHANLERAIAFVHQLQPRRAYFTHMSHEVDHAIVDAELPENIHLAYDGLQLSFEIA